MGKSPTPPPQAPPRSKIHLWSGNTPWTTRANTENDKYDAEDEEYDAEDERTEGNNNAEDERRARDTSEEAT